MPATAPLRPALHALALAAALTAAAAPALADDVYYLNVQGIPGNSTDRFFKNWIEVSGFDWGVSVGAPAGPGGASGRAEFDDFSWQQAIDRSVAGLFSAAATGRQIDRVELDAVVQVGDQRLMPYFKMSFRDVQLTRLHVAGDRGQVPLLDAAFSYGYVEMEYRTVNADGTLGAATRASYDLVRNRGDLGALVGVYALGVAGPSLAPVPEPETWALLLAGLGVVGGAASRRRARA